MVTGQTVNRDGAARFVAERFGRSAAQTVADLGGGDWSRAFSFRLNDRDLVIRFGRHRDDFAKDQQAMAFAQPDLPVPTVAEIGEVTALPGVYYALSERHFGVFLEALDEQGWRKLLPALLRALDALRQIQPSGTGVDWSGPDNSAPLSWRQWLLASLEDRPGERVSGWRTRLRETPDINEIFVRGEGVLRTLVGSCPEVRHVLHCDLLNRNVLVSEDASRLEAVFDWGCSLAGDFLYDVAWLSFWAPWYPALEAINVGRAIWDHYRAIGLRVENFDQRLACYELHIGLGHIAYAAFTGRDDDQRAVAHRTQQVLEHLPVG